MQTSILPAAHVDLSAIMRFREAVSEAQKANAHALWMAHLLTRKDLHEGPGTNVAGLTIDREALMTANRSLDQTNGILWAILAHNGCA